MNSGLPRILIVDDEKDHLDSLKRLLRKNFEAEFAISGPEALKILKNTKAPFDAIVSDQRMPEMSGSTFLAEAQKIDPKATRILMTGFAEIEAIIEAVNLGHIWRYISKPYEPDDLRQTLKQACERTQMTRALDESKIELEKLLSQLRAKDFARERLLRVLLHEFRTAPQIIQNIKELDQAGESFPSLEPFYASLIERFKILENDVESLLSDEKKFEKIPKQKIYLSEILKNHLHKTSNEFDDVQIEVPAEEFSTALKSVIESLKSNHLNAEPEIEIEILSNNKQKSVFLSIKVQSEKEIPLPTSLQNEKQSPETAWRSIFEPFVGVEDFKLHSRGLRLNSARAIRTLELLGAKTEMQSKKSPTFSHEITFAIKIQ